MTNEELRDILREVYAMLIGFVLGLLCVCAVHSHTTKPMTVITIHRGTTPPRDPTCKLKPDDPSSASANTTCLNQWGSGYSPNTEIPPIVSKEHRVPLNHVPCARRSRVGVR